MPRHARPKVDRTILEMAIVGYQSEIAKISAKIADIKAQLGQSGPGRPKAAAIPTDHAAPQRRRTISKAGRARIAAARGPPDGAGWKRNRSDWRVNTIPSLSTPAGSSYEIDKPHPLIRATMKGIRDLRRGGRAMDPVLITAGEGRLDLRVGPESIKRALWVLDGFIKGFENARFQVSVKDGSTLVQQNGQSVSVRLREGLHRFEIPPEQPKNSWDDRYFYRPTGVLNFEITGEWGRKRRYSDTATAPLERKAERIADAIRELLEEQKRRADERQVAEIIRQHEARQEARRERQRAEMQQRTESLMKDVEAWHQSQKIRSYLMSAA